MIPIQGPSKGDPAETAAESGVKILKALKPKIVFPVLQYSKQKDRVYHLKQKMNELQLFPKIIFEKPGTEHTLSEYQPT